MILRVQRAVLLTLMVGTPVLVTSFVTLDPFNIPKFALLIAGCSLVTALWVVQLILGRSPALSLRDLVVPAAIILPLGVGWIFSSYRTWAVFGQYSRLQGLVPYALLALFGIETAVFLRGRARRVVWALAASGGLVGLGQLAGVMGFSPTGGLSEASTIGNSNFVGGFLAITFPLALHLWWSSESNEKREKVLALAITVLVGEGLILSFSEGGQLAALCGTCILLAAHLRRRWLKLLSLVVAGVIPLATVLVISLPALHAFGGFTATLRSYWWQSALSVAEESPVIGYGPNAFALDGSKNRPLEDVLAHRGYVPGFTPLQVDYQTTDDPHSVPLSFLVSAGGLGLVGFLLAALWLGREATRLRSREPDATVAFSAALAAYFVQSLLSVDELSLRVAFWGCVGGLLAGAAASPGREGPDQVGPRPTLRLVAGAVAFSLVLGGGLFLAFSFLRSDQLARAGMLAFEAGEPATGESRLRQALALRADPTYKQILAEYLGIAALEGEPDAAEMITEMRATNHYLNEIPDVGALQGYARLMNYWGEYEASADESALEIYANAHELDPNNPLILVEQAEVLTDLGDASAAQELLAPLEDKLRSAMPEFWGALAMVRLEAGDEEGAEDALRVGTRLDPTDCRVSLARQLLTLQAGRADPSDERARLNLALACDPGLYARFLERAGLNDG